MTITDIPRATTPAARAGHDPSAAWRHVDWSLVLATGAIAALGLLMVYSATRNRLGTGTVDTYFLERQGIFVAIGLAVMAVLAVVDYRRLRDLAVVAFLGTVAVLALVVSPVGTRSKGAQAWFQLGSFQLEPSEFCKLGLIVVVAAYLGSRKGGVGFKALVVTLLLAALPMGLIMLQPDLGTALVVGAILVGMLVVAGTPARYLALLAVLAVALVAVVLQLGLLKSYQKDRLTSFTNQEAGTQGAAYNLKQSKIAIGSGGVTGKGLFEGTQTNLSYVPEQHTDFIFTVVGEELGLRGGAVLLGLYGFVVWRIWRASLLAQDRVGSLLCIGVLSMLVFQVFENAGMTMGIMPITGITLPLMSYGGSSLLATFAAIGLVLNVRMRRFS